MIDDAHFKHIVACKTPRKPLLARLLCMVSSMDEPAAGDFVMAFFDWARNELATTMDTVVSESCLRMVVNSFAQPWTESHYKDLSAGVLLLLPTVEALVSVGLENLEEVASLLYNMSTKDNVKRLTVPIPRFADLMGDIVRRFVRLRASTKEHPMIF
ncbi:hypothetical protein ADUPG1_003842, partial [Aduncisulcus paluster]